MAYDQEEMKQLQQRVGKTVLLSESCGQSILRGSAECSRGFPHGWLHPFPAFSVLLSNHPSSAGCVGENSKTHVHVDISPSHMVRSVHEFCLRDRGDENPWMDDPSQPEPQHKRLRRISPGTSWLMRRDMGAMLPHNLS